MVKKIHKYPLQLADHQQIEMAFSAKILSVGLDSNESLSVWVIEDPEEEKEETDFWIVGTGHIMTEQVLQWGNFVGSIVDGPFVWHVFYC